MELDLSKLSSEFEVNQTRYDEMTYLIRREVSREKLKEVGGVSQRPQAV